LRWGFGLGNPVLSQTDPDTGYRFQPNQKVVRFGKTLEYNQYSQRSDPTTRNKPANTFRILMVGDSVLNGGNPVDQTETISEQLEAQLSTSGRSVEVLNASAGSWGIGNQLGYLRQFGTLDCDVLILQIGTHDLTQPMSSGDRVGVDVNYPDRDPVLALEEAVRRYLIPKLQPYFPSPKIPAEIPATSSEQQQFQQNMERFRAIVAAARQEQTAVAVLYTPNWTDVLPTPSSPPYKAEFFQVLSRLNVPAIDVHADWSALPAATVEPYFRDSVHLSVEGNQAVARLLARTNFLTSLTEARSQFLQPQKIHQTFKTSREMRVNTQTTPTNYDSTLHLYKTTFVMLSSLALIPQYFLPNRVKNFNSVPNGNSQPDRVWLSRP